MSKKAYDLTGQKSYRLTALRVSEKKNGKRMWLCLCDCGNLINVSTSDFRSGKTKSCGCYRSANLKHVDDADLPANKEERKRIVAERMASPVDKESFNDNWMFEP